MKKNKTKKLHYIGYCFAKGEEKEYQCNVASNLKMHYVGDAAKRAGYDVIFYSLCKTKKRFQKCKKSNDEGGVIKHIASFGKNSILSRILNLFLFRLQLICYVLFRVKKTDDVLLYHSVKTTKLVSRLLKIKRCRFILEVEEIFAYAADGIKIYLEQELKNISKFKYFIFVNDYLPQYLNVENGKCVVVYGSYQPQGKAVAGFEDGKIHVLYAGAIEKLNNGAFVAIEVSRLLPNNFKTHILGKGEEWIVNDAKALIEKINRETGEEKVIYEGFYSGSELDAFMNMCDIGIGTYKIKEGYSNFIFPSKLVSYMCHNLRVVTGRSDCYEKAIIAQNWFFYDTDDYESIANAIVKAGDSDIENNSSKQIEQLDEQLVEQFKNMLITGNWRK